MDKVPEENIQNRTCKNCEHEFAGNFCSNCGQPAKDFDKPFGFVFYDFLGNFFSFDSRFLKSFKLLVFYPGRLTIEFFKGKRASYTPPFRLFIFVSFILFLLLQFLTNKTLDRSIDAALTSDTSQILKISQVDSISKHIPINDSSTTNVIRAEIESMPNIVLSGDSGIITASLNTSGNLREFLNNLASNIESQKIEPETNEELRQRNEIVRLLQSPEIFTSKVLQYISWASFFMLPVFALILALFYIRLKLNAIRHLVFSIHLHCFFFIVLSIIILLKVVFTGTWTNHLFWLVPGMVVYYIVASVNFYQYRIWPAILKALGVFFTYGIISSSIIVFLIVRVILSVLQ